VDVDVAVVLDELVAHRFLKLVAGGAELGEPIDRVLDEVVAVRAVLHALSKTVVMVPSSLRLRTCRLRLVRR
jgi:hypothetical protein